FRGPHRRCGRRSGAAKYAPQPGVTTSDGETCSLMFLHVVPASTDGKRRVLRRFVPVAALLGLLTAGCSWFGGGSSHQSPPPSATAAPGDGSAQPSTFPNLASVPDQAPPSTPKIERDKLVQGLMADRSHAEYTDQSLGAETANVPAASPPPPEPK